MPHRPLSSALTALTLAAGLVLAPGTGAAQQDTLRDPIVVSSQNGRLTARLEVFLDTLAQVPDTDGQYQRMSLRSYRLTLANGTAYDVKGFPGPTFRVFPGDSVEILLVNRLKRETSTGCAHYPAVDSLPARDTFPNCFHGLNDTNLHFHGFHVTPRGTGDNVLEPVKAGDSTRYAFRVPPNQSPGTHWYHPHMHGAVALQVMNGMSGAFLMAGGPLDVMVERLGMRDRLVAIQQVDTVLNLMGSVAVPAPQASLINGQHQPVIEMLPGEVQRWRIVNENVSATAATYRLIVGSGPSAAAPALYDIARDGVQYAPQNYDTIPDDTLLVWPGSRLDVFAQAPLAEGTHTLKAVRVSQRASGRGRRPGAGADTVALFQVRVVSGSRTVPSVLPTALPPLPPFLANLDTTVRDTSAFVQFTDVGAVPTSLSNPVAVYLGTDSTPYQKYDPDSVFLDLPLDGTQLWKVSNASAIGVNHPFHIHINPFQVVAVVQPDTADPNSWLYAQLNAAAARGFPIWLDTVPLPLSNGSDLGYIVIRQQYADFTGKFVMHCHILGHEERGMMQLLEVTRHPRRE
ncbi:MAG TPA: multicopper oxidase family protein [Longimicrobiaceae bacterium]|nr:multicopper oxidase family protein [Longimicrobiaceae bacterium]